MTKVMFILSSISIALKSWLVKHTSIYTNLELKGF